MAKAVVGQGSIGPFAWPFTHLFYCDESTTSLTNKTAGLFQSLVRSTIREIYILQHHKSMNINSQQPVKSMRSLRVTSEINCGSNEIVGKTLSSASTVLAH